MISIRNYLCPATLEEAYQVLNEKKSNTVLGGGAFLRLGSKRIDTALDLSKLNLSYITETAKEIKIGAMTTFRDIELNPLLKQYYNGILSAAVKNIGGVQLRNIVTVGGTVYPRYGFSDLITALLVLDTDVVLQGRGRIPLEEFLEEKNSKKDILVEVIIRKNPRIAVFEMLRNSQSDYAILNAAASRLGDDFKIVVGARPLKAKVAQQASEYLRKCSASSLDSDVIKQAAELTAEELSFGSNIRGSKIYRQKIAKVLVQRAILGVEKARRGEKR